jgi:catechol 2,3-dioxygenase-like lactoylglutathione lyase family enzyme
MIVDNLYARSVFFVKDAELPLKFYTEILGFSLDWNYKEQYRAFVFEVTDCSGRGWMKHGVLKGDTGRLLPKQSRRV